MEQGIAHGGNLGEARRRFPTAPEPWLDLSTGINPFAYPLPGFPPEALTRLPEPDAVARLEALLARRTGALPEEVVAAPGTQILLPWIARLLPPGRARIPGPTYAEHARAATLAGHALTDGPAEMLTLVNPNNPDGRLLARAEVLSLARDHALTVVDEAFMEAAPADESVAGQVGSGGLVVLRSFGKFHGLAGVRLGFAIAPAPLAARLRASLGPWAVSGPALFAGLAALGDEDWPAAMRRRLREEAAALDAVLAAGGCEVLGGTSLFRLARVPDGTHDRLARAGILTRRFAFWPDRLRFGLPPDAAARARLAAALA
ncbi:threonine-phosphate decarboxylase CobD [Roseococcus sp. YIM B11640]|uniref:threonine-phosphate decarboxylase CobD n=1 Tax=Roseococcus sp. YIM B11640 TaxID=3133973 RepID=UPI003C7AA5D5